MDEDGLRQEVARLKLELEKKEKEVAELKAAVVLCSICTVS